MLNCGLPAPIVVAGLHPLWHSATKMWEEMVEVLLELTWDFEAKLADYMDANVGSPKRRRLRTISRAWCLYMHSFYQQ